jgi:hypothetical protein
LIKLFNLPIFSNIKKQNNFPFINWIIYIKNKFEGNIDYFINFLLKLYYIINYIIDNTANYICSRLCQGAADGYQTAEELFNHLE